MRAEHVDALQITCTSEKERCRTHLMSIKGDFDYQKGYTKENSQEKVCFGVDICIFFYSRSDSVV